MVKVKAIIVSSLMIFFLLSLTACSTYEAKQAIESRQKEYTLNTEAWQAARLRLKAMCPGGIDNTKVVRDALVETYRAMNRSIDSDIPLPLQAARDLKDGKLNAEIFNEKVEAQAAIAGDGDCNVRIVKITNAPTFDDWQWDWLPPYETIVSAHEEELRKRVTPKLYEEYMLGLSHYLAQKADGHQITARQFVYAFNTGWKWMFQNVQQEKILLQQNFLAAQYKDAATWNTITTIAAGLATITTAALLASASASERAAAEANARAAAINAYRPSPAPTSCNAYPTGGGYYHVRCW
jgi:hypothetical protein